MPYQNVADVAEPGTGSAAPLAATTHPQQVLAEVERQPLLAVADRLAQALAATAVERDRAGGHAGPERELIRASGLLTLTIPREHGGPAGDDGHWPLHFQVLRRLAAADSALAHLYGFHHLQLAGATLYGTAAQRERELRRTVEQRLFWGNALNPLDKGCKARRVDGGWRLHGTKTFASGSVGADRLTISAWDESLPDGQGLLIAVVDANAPGLDIRADWDAFGQKQTDSGSVRFDEVFIADADVFQAPGTVPTPQATLRSQVAQLTMANLYAGIARGAFDAATRHVADARAWFASGVERAVDDPAVQLRLGELRVALRAAEVLCEAASVPFAAAWRRGARLTAEERGDVAIAVAEAKVAAHRASIELSSQLFELTGARSTSQRLGLDRFWRNARVHTLHDPVDHKLRDLGRHAVDGRLPTPTAYS